MNVIPRKPIVSSSDSEFVRELKRSVLWLFDEVQRLEVQGDNTTTYVSPSAAGKVIHAFPGDDTAPVYLTLKTDDTTYTGDVHGNGRHNTATETGATVKVGAIAAGETLPTSDAYAWFVAHKEKWDVGGTDTELWTIQPEIFR